MSVKLSNQNIIDALIGTNSQILKKYLGYSEEEDLSAYMYQVVIPVIKTLYWPNTAISTNGGYYSECMPATSEFIETIKSFILSKDTKIGSSSNNDNMEYENAIISTKIEMARIQSNVDKK